MSTIKSYEVYARVSKLHLGHATGRESRRALTRRHRASVRTPCCVPLRPEAAAGPNAAGVALLARRVEDIPRRNSFGVLAIELPPPSDLGEFDTYEAVLFEPGVGSFVVTLTMTPNHAWAGLLTEISQEFSPTMRVIVRPASLETGATGSPVLTGHLSAWQEG